MNVRIGATFPDFNKTGGMSPAKPVIEEPFIGYQGGLSIEIAHYRYYGARVELSYVKKGARETFADNGNQIKSTTNLHYGQVVILPLILKPGFRKFNPFVGVGGYGAYLLSASHAYRANRGLLRSDTQLVKNLNNIDYGLAVSLGVYLGRHPLELPYEAGMQPIFNQQLLPASAKNRAVSLHFSL